MATLSVGGTTVFDGSALQSGVTGSPTSLNVPTHLSQWLVTTAFGWGSGTNVWTANWAITPSTRGYSTLGAEMSQSSGVFTFPVTGYWLVEFNCMGRGNSAAPNMEAHIQTTVDGSAYLTAAQRSLFSTADATKTSTNVKFLFDVTSVSTHKVRFATEYVNSVNGYHDASSTINKNGATFIRLGAT